MTRRTRSRSWRVLLAGLTVGSLLGCSSSDGSKTGSPAVLENADQHWRPDLDDDGKADLIVVDDDEVRFAVQSNGGYTTVRDDDGSDLVVDVSDEATVTCSADGVFVQTFERGVEQPVTNALRLSRLEVSGSTGTLIPSPSFFGFDSDFELPRLGSGCPTSE